MMGDFYSIQVTNPSSIEAGTLGTYRMEHNGRQTAAVEEFELDVLLDLWAAGGPYKLAHVSADPWLTAAFFRLCRANLVRIHAGTGVIHADRRKQSTATEDAIPAEVRDHSA